MWVFTGLAPRLSQRRGCAAVASGAPVDRFSRRRYLIWGASVLLIALHIWAPASDAPTLILGILPWDLAFHLAWMAGAALLIHLAAQFAWRDVDAGVSDE